MSSDPNSIAVTMNSIRVKSSFLTLEVKMAQAKTKITSVTLRVSGIKILDFDHSFDHVE